MSFFDQNVTSDRSLSGHSEYAQSFQPGGIPMLAGLSHNRGYTLLEVTLVVTLLGLLSAIAIPTYRGYAERANETRAIADLGMLSLDLARWQLNTGSFPPDLATAGLDGRRDPWGQPYVYLNLATATIGEMRKDKNLVPLNTDFDLYSAGEDGSSQAPLTARASRDDIVRANNGGYIGSAEDY